MEIVATAMTGESLYVHEGFALIGFGLGMTGFLELRGNSNLDGLCECRSETDGKPFPELVFARLLRVWISSKSPVAGQSSCDWLVGFTAGALLLVLRDTGSPSQDNSKRATPHGAFASQGHR